MHARVDEFARPMTGKMGKRIDEARGEVQLSADSLARYAKNAERFLAPVTLNPTIGKAQVEYGPIGIIAAAGKVEADYELAPLSNIDETLQRLAHGQVASRVVRIVVTAASDRAGRNQPELAAAR